MDITLDDVDGLLDVALLDGDLVTDDGLRTAVAFSLLCDRRAEEDDIIPDGTDNRRGWWADAIADQDGDKWGSRLWLLSREKELPEVRRRAEAYAEEALDWLLADGVVSEIVVTAETLNRSVLWLRVDIQRGDGTRISDRYQYVWS
ncbi:Mu-like prophage protein gp46 [Vreelandella subterranea]|uniref:Mu-like prophage protein gp46 n=1 Tax=Vreelandella subterranea TaxID=416874 RepID=A0A1H9W2S7_9GAMM|nr:phage GP46 family protein [Halomonas subterranea]SES28089.1 Mu-like prophage protein gp46 [Halomonas subterranea]